MSGKVFEYFCNLLKIGEGDNFDYYFSDVTRLFNLNGLDSWSNGWKLQNTVKCVIPALLLSFMGFEPLFILLRGDDYYLLLQALVIATPGLVFFVKLLMAVRNRNKLASLVKQVQNEFWSVEDDDGLQKKKLLQRGSRPMMLLVRFYAIQFAACASVYCIVPVYNMVLHSKFDTPFKLPLPFFDNEAWGVYIVNYGIQLACFFFIAPAAVCLDAIQPMLIVQCTTQLDILNKQLEKLTKTNEDTTKPDTKKLLREIHESHIKLRAFTVEIGKTFAVANFFQLFLSAIMIAFTIYATTASPLGRSMELYMLTSDLISELALFCFSGQFLSNKFEKFYEKFLELPWHEFSREEKRIFLLILHDVQQPMVIKTFFNSELTMVMFKNILNSAYSYYAILQALSA